MEYDVYGNIFKKTYTKEYQFRPFSLLYDMDLTEYNNATKLYSALLQENPLVTGIYPPYHFMNEKRRELEKLKNCLLEEINKEEYNSKSFIKYELIKTIDTNREFKDGDLFTYNNNDYKVTYKYNSDKDKHELYIDYICNLIVDNELDSRINKLIDETNELIKNHNDKIKKQIRELTIITPEVVHKKISIPMDNKSWFTKLMDRFRS